ncbi:hypothetical protein LAJ19_16835 (plasmid) [Deinococcus taeanensis]|uniref:hypothetical protein n=1 Tax=Deinococcus taeanensis TaxID=2737050 RepID=UPI001CDBA215|nr:hypothetical protein [Deinococcus taeanensis]UBV44452.1 hypothetical protein LAJ19_16835 [Deinococcus taeanensis]
MTLHFLTLAHHQDLRRAAEQQRAARLARPSAPLPRPPVTLQLPATQTRCSTC